MQEPAMPLPEDAYAQLAPDLRMCRLLNGMWQVSGAHGPIDPAAAGSSMVAHLDAGFTTWDLADHYGPAEDFIGEFRRRVAATRGATALDGVRAFTKWVPRPGPMTRQVVEAAIEGSRHRMDVAAIDLLQFHWWDYGDDRYLEALEQLAELHREGSIRHLALTNFDTAHVEAILAHGIEVASNQVQYSLVDLRPDVRMAPFCLANGVGLLTYGTLCGGLLSDRYLRRPEPSWAELNTASLRKYKQMIDAWGGWPLFQELLTVLRRIAGRHRVSIANVAVRAILHRPAVAGVIVGVRLGVSEHLVDNARVFGFELDDDDHDRIQAVVSKGRDLYQLIGDCGDEYRR